MFLPVQIPTTVKQQGLQGGQAIAGGFTPMHALVFLAAGDDQIITFLDVSTADVMAVRSTVAVV